MNILKTNISLKEAIIKVSEIFSISVIAALFIGVYLLGLTLGYVAGKKDSQEDFLVFLKETSPTVAPTPTFVISPRPTSAPKNATSVKKVSWGGPELWQAINQRRTEFGVNPLTQKDELCTIASIRLNELLELDKLDGHEGFSNMQEERPDLKWIFEKYSTIAEFLAMGGETTEETVTLWENTLGHKKLLTGGEYVWGCIYAQNTFAVAITAF